ncbi:MAG TPA: carboxypeptidase regulatory-like domain-containing protein, partial [Candidatus Aenigmarchaeota archaeon]|nr:carboxypeptidase regulatory-like domain-containing protein [Candidatus Aenigmarchaeota archaeon]
MKLKILILAFSFMLLIKVWSAHALTLELEAEPEILWFHKSTSFKLYAKCLNDSSPIENASVTAFLIKDGNEILNKDLTFQAGRYFSEFDLSFNPGLIGYLNLTVNCSYGNESIVNSTSIEIKKLTLEILLENEKEVHKYEEFSLDLKFLIFDEANKQGLLITPSQETFKVYFVSGNVKREASIKSYGISGDKQTLTLLVPDLEEGLYKLEVVGFKDGESINASTKKLIKVLTPLRIHPLVERIECYSGSLCEKNITMRVEWDDGSIEEFTQENFEGIVWQTMQPIDIASVDCDEDYSICTLGLRLIGLNPGRYDIEIYAKAGGIESSRVGIRLDIVLPIKGTLMDAAGKVISMKLTLINKETGEIEQASTNNAGKYSLSILPGIYDAEMDFPGLKVKVFNVTINEETVSSFGGESIRYDGFRMQLLEGLKVAKVVVVEFAFPFEHALIHMPYDDSLILNEENLKVYACSRWNFGRRYCSGEWKEIKIRIDPIRNFVEFNASSFSAFALGEEKSLNIYTVYASKKEVYMGDSVIINGKVLDDEGKDVEAATVNFTFLGTNLSSSTLTGADGSFVGSITAPYQEGVFKLRVKVSKHPYVSDEEELVIRVLKKKDLSIFVPDKFEVFLDEPAELKVEVFNSGQINLTDITLLVSGIPKDQYLIFPSKINKLDPNEKKEVSLIFNFSSEYCKEGCNQFYLITLTAKGKTYLGERIEKGASFTLKLNKKSQAKEEKPQGFSLFPTGMFSLPSISISNQYL